MVKQAQSWILYHQRVESAENLQQHTFITKPLRDEITSRQLPISPPISKHEHNMALTVGSITSSKGVPKSVAQITKDASEYEFNALVPLKYWLRTAAALVQQVRPPRYS